MELSCGRTLALGYGRTLVLGCGFALILASAGAALAEDAEPREDGLPPLEAVDQATLEQQSGTIPVADGNGGTMPLPGSTGSGISGPDQASFSSSHGSIANSAVSSSSLSATTAGGAVSVGQ
jgi:hypothetical protein